MTLPSAYRVQWLANKTGTWAHAVITDIDTQVIDAVLEDPNGGPFTIDQLDQQLSQCQKRNQLVRAERPGDKRCGSCVRNVAELDEGILQARREWALSHLESVIELLAQLAPIGDPKHVIL